MELNMSSFIKQHYDSGFDVSEDITSDKDVMEKVSHRCHWAEAIGASILIVVAKTMLPFVLDCCRLWIY
jgi:hypothetical protein